MAKNLMGRVLPIARRPSLMLMRGILVGSMPTSRWAGVPGLCAGSILMLLAASPAQAQVVGACPPPKKFAAGACVTACPGGYEDRGRDCVYRNQSR